MTPIILKGSLSQLNGKSKVEKKGSCWFYKFNQVNAMQIFKGYLVA